MAMIGVDNCRQPYTEFVESRGQAKPPSFVNTVSVGVSLIRGGKAKEIEPQKISEFESMIKIMLREDQV